MNLRDAQQLGDSLWGRKYGIGRAWHMFPNDPEKEFFKLEWPDGVVRGKGKTFEEAFKDAGVEEANNGL